MDATEEIAGYYMEVVGTSFFTLVSIIAHAANEVAAFHYHIHRFGNEQLYATNEGVDVYLLVFYDFGFPKVKSDTSAESIKACSMERLTLVYVFVATITH